MSKVKLFTLVLGAALLLFLAAGCTLQARRPSEAAPGAPALPAQERPATTAVPVPGGMGGYPMTIPPYGGMQPSGIWVSGQGKVTAQPDLALLNAGVEATAPTVQEARSKAAGAMNRIMEALAARGIQKKDIQTRYFSIEPRYSWREVLRCPEEIIPRLPEGTPPEKQPIPPRECMKHSEQILLGYRVSNQVTVKIRDFEILGQIIDEVAEAGGDLTRIQGIRFTIEDPAPLQAQAREKAVQDALAKAQQFAQLTGVGLGRLLYLTESGGGIPVVQTYAPKMRFEVEVPAPTPISGGELEVSVNIQAVFAIE